LTREGLASALNEFAAVAGVSLSIDELAIPVHDGVRGTCEVLEFDPLYVANEGRFVGFVPETQADRAVAVMHAS
jgi:hydrogenase expression/formation protein HypE